MRRMLLAALTVALLLGFAAPALAHPTVTLDPTLPVDLTHASTDNVEYLGRFPEHFGTAGGRLVEDRYYITDPRGVYVYDVSTPEAPTLMGSLPLYQQELGAALAQEEPDTDGDILLVDGAPGPYGTAQLRVVDVSDPANMSILSSLDVTDHTWTCVSAEMHGVINGCAYAYGRTGHIIDLTDPYLPQRLDYTWREAASYGLRSNSPYAHDLTEIRPGLVMTAGAEAILLDTTDPADPVELARITQPGRFSALGYHSVEWANGGRDPIVVLGTEISPEPSASGMGAGSDCEGENSVIETWDASEVVAALEAYEETGDLSVFDDAQFHFIDAFDAGGRGIFLEGQAPGHVLYCAHWMRLHPDFDAGGLMAVSYYDRGTRFVEIAADGTMAEVGWMTATEGYSGSPRWVSEDVVYVSDYRRGMEILRFTHEEATGVVERDSDAIVVGSRYVPPSALNLSLERASTPALGIFLLLLAGVELRRRRRA